MKYFFTTLAPKLIISLVLIASTLTLSAQETGISPYSRIGLGDINTNHSPSYTALGGASVSLSDFNLININNPASYSSFLKHMPVFEIDGATQFLNLKSASNSASLTATTFTKLAIGIPVNNRMGVSLGLLPYTTTGYDITSENSQSGIGSVTYSFNGKGGINRAYLGAGYSLIDKDSMNLSIGLNFSFLFGNIEKSRRVEFPDDNVALNSILSQQTGHNGFDLELGLLYKQKVTDKFSYSLGASISNGARLNANRSELFATYTDFSNVERIQDTLSYVSGNKGEIKIPLNIKLGGSVNFNKNFEVSVQYQAQDWSSFDEKFDQSSAKDSLASSSSFSLGIRYTPTDVFSTAKYYERIQYRAGVRYGNTPLQFNNTQIKEFGTSFGLGLPIRKSASSKNQFKSLSMINIGVDFGKRGTTENGLIEENFTTVYFGISIMPQTRNRWFVKRKFN